jgi:ribosomal subunit interface protein
MASSPRDDSQWIVATKGEVSESAKAYATEKLGRALQHAHGPVLLARLKLSRVEDADRSEVAEATLDLNGRLVRAQVGARRMDEAIDLLSDRLIRQLEQVANRERTRRRRAGNGPPARPAVARRPPEEREVVAHKSFAIERATFDEAAFDMDVLDYDFFLYTDAETEEDRVVYRDNGDVRVASDPPLESVTEALERLDAGGEPFVFFREAATNRGAVAYLRYDGHYGLIRPADG